MRSKRSGSFSTYALLAMAVILVGSVGVSGYVVADMKRATGEQNAIQAFEAAQGGLEQAVTLSYANLPYTGGVFTQANYVLSSSIDPMAPGCKVWATVYPNANNLYAWVTATANVNGNIKSVRLLVYEHNVGIWNNAIFAGSGASGQAINGNVSIAGSVHILGDG